MVLGMDLTSLVNRAHSSRGMSSHRQSFLLLVGSYLIY